MLKILLALAGRHFGMSMEEMCEEAHVQRRAVYVYLKALETCGVEIVRQWEPDRHGWHYLYKLKSVKGQKLNITRMAQ